MQANHFEIIRDTRLEGSSPFITYIVPCYNVEREVMVPAMRHLQQ